MRRYVFLGIVRLEQDIQMEGINRQDYSRGFLGHCKQSVSERMIIAHVLHWQSVSLLWLPAFLASIMASQGSASALPSGATLAQAASAGSSVVGPKGKAKATAKAVARHRIVRPRIDIDDQISEANRVHDLLKKMSQAAKSLKKNQTKAKQRLIKKATRLSPQDLERIAVLKRIFGDSTDEQVPVSSGSSSASSSAGSSGQKGVTDMHGTLRTMLKDLPGAEDVVMGLGRGFAGGPTAESAGQADESAAARLLSAGASIAAGAQSVPQPGSETSVACTTGEDADAVQQDELELAPESPAV